MIENKCLLLFTQLKREKPIRFQNHSFRLTLYVDHNIFRTPSSNKYTCIQSMGCPFELLFPLSRSDKFE